MQLGTFRLCDRQVFLTNVGFKGKARGHLPFQDESPFFGQALFEVWVSVGFAPT